MANELLEFPGGVLGVALNLDVRSIGAVILGDANTIAGGPAGHPDRRGALGPGRRRLPRPGDQPAGPADRRPGRDRGGGEPRRWSCRPPRWSQRQGVSEPLQTGIKAIDAMTPIGRGQRQLIIGDRKTGKTAVCVDTIMNQKENWETGDQKQQVRCIYVAIGQKGTTIAGVRQSLEDAGALAYTTIVAAPASDSAGFKWLAPYTGSAIGQHWMYQGKHVLIIFDDLSKQAEAYRAISLLLRRPPGREAYPGDVFYLHSRLLERCAKLSDELGAGFDDRPADHRDQGRRRLGVHPDQRHLDHRRPVLPGVRPVQLGCPAGHQRRHLGLPGRWRRPGQGHAQGVRHAASGPVRLPRAGGVRRLRFRPGRRVQAGAGPRVPAGRAAQAAAVLAVPGARSRSSRSGPVPAGTWTGCRWRTSAGSRPSSCSTCGTRRAARWTAIRSRRTCPTTPRRRCWRRSTSSPTTFTTSTGIILGREPEVEADGRRPRSARRRSRSAGRRRRQEVTAGVE